ncbi:hypothetical protein, partial [Mesorhizobium sp.]|uniref:hypothetical protein n=1 Tax=Mesorhizobium sp. TaxID=1871066 RepID=UPI00345C5B15
SRNLSGYFQDRIGNIFNIKNPAFSERQDQGSFNVPFHNKNDAAKKTNMAGSALAAHIEAFAPLG